MRLGNLTATFTGDIPPRSTSVVYCGVSIFRDACYQFIATFFITYISYAGVLDSTSADAYIAQMAVINALIIAYRIWDGVNDPIMGTILEKVHFKWGKYKPWILIGGVLNSIVILVLFLAQPKGWGFVALFAIFYFLWDIVWTINDIAYWSMLPSLTKDEKRRNSLTSYMQICISIGVFAIYAVATMLPGFIDASYSVIYQWICVIVTVLFLASQIALVLVCKEHERPSREAEAEEEKTRLRDVFTIFVKNKQVTINIVSILLNYLASGLLTAFASYYTYITYGYRSEAASTVALLLTIMYAVATLIAQFAYPFITRIKWFNRRHTLLVSLALIAAGYLMMFFFGFPIFGGNALAVGMEFLLYIAAFVLFLGQGLLSIILIIQMQSTIEYNEYLYGERKEAIVSSLRALVAKWGSALQQGIIYLTLFATGLYGITSRYSELEQQVNAGIISASELDAFAAEVNSTIQASQKVGLSVGMIFIPLAILTVSIIMAAFIFKIDEPMYRDICAELDKRHEAASAEQEKTAE